MNIKPLCFIFEQMKKKPSLHGNTIFFPRYYYYFNRRYIHIGMQIFMCIYLYIRGIYGMIHQACSAPFYPLIMHLFTFKFLEFLSIIKDYFSNTLIFYAI